jgi:hypothetical protein
MNLFLVLLSGICWSIVYIELIRKGFKDKTYGMPLFALGLNFAWEIIYSVDSLVLNPASVQGVVNLIWAALDAVIVYTFFKYGRRDFPDKAKKYFAPFSILAFISCFAIQFAFYFHFESVPASKYSAFAQNAAMSIMFLTMLFSRGSTRGQTVLMAAAKWIGTLAPTILGGFIEEFNIYIILMGAVCFVFDLIYVVILHKWKKTGL